MTRSGQNGPHGDRAQAIDEIRIGRADPVEAGPGVRSPGYGSGRCGAARSWAREALKRAVMRPPGRAGEDAAGSDRPATRSLWYALMRCFSRARGLEPFRQVLAGHCVSGESGDPVLDPGERGHSTRASGRREGPMPAHFTKSSTTSGGQVPTLNTPRE
ncbi:hypothetical protein SAV14893_091380 [Streptomyces avermitilis]|uniref:Uncharacterized protein n=1 Tax=Streptomyces avermitilis TaxID=33903 RepID=A0A4D4MD27_STRAX|nr:hypothetical protein SAV14893_091380 [Streptomyces avermitilis]